MADTAQLEDGFYWVRRGLHWRVAAYIKREDMWFFTGDSGFSTDDSFDEVDPRPIKRDNGNNN